MQSFPTPLNIERAPDGHVSLSWTDAPSLLLEEAAALTDCVQWRPVLGAPVVDGDRRVLTLPA